MILPRLPGKSLDMTPHLCGRPPSIGAPLAGKAILIVCTAVILLSGTLLIGPLKNSSDHLAARLYPPSVGSTAIALEHQP